MRAAEGDVRVTEGIVLMTRMLTAGYHAVLIVKTLTKFADQFADDLALTDEDSYVHYEDGDFKSQIMFQQLMVLMKNAERDNVDWHGVEINNLRTWLKDIVAKALKSKQEMTALIRTRAWALDNLSSTMFEMARHGEETAPEFGRIVQLVHYLASGRRYSRADVDVVDFAKVTANTFKPFNADVKLVAEPDVWADYAEKLVAYNRRMRRFRKRVYRLVCVLKDDYQVHCMTEDVNMYL